MNTHVQNLLDLFDSVDDSTRQAELSWYPREGQNCKMAAQNLGIDAETFTRMVAVLSPNLEWRFNIQAAVDIVQKGTSGYGFPKNQEKARRILAGDKAALSGPKVTRFFWSLFTPEVTSDVVVVDIHAWRAWENNPTGQPPAIKGRLYEEIENDYKTAAAMRGVKPGDFQAVVWCAVREIAKKQFAEFRKNGK